MNELIPFDFEDKSVNFFIEGEDIWVAVQDVADALDYPRCTKPSGLVRKIPQEWTAVHPMHIRSENGAVQRRNTVFISEQGLYLFLGRSDKEKALPFQKKVAGEILPKIRRTGSYAPEPAQPAETLNVKAAAALNDLVGRTTLCVNQLERENRWLREKDRMRREMENLRTRLAQKNTPLSKSEEARIVALSKSASASQIARLMNRSVSAIRRALKRAKEAV